jgi:hypothetical protein
MTVGAIVYDEYFRPMQMVDLDGDRVRLRYLRRVRKGYLATPKVREERREVVARWREAPLLPVKEYRPTIGARLMDLAAKAAERLERDVTLSEAAGWVARMVRDLEREVPVADHGWTWTPLRSETSAARILSMRRVPLRRAPSSVLVALSELERRLHGGDGSEPVIKEIYVLSWGTVSVGLDRDGRIVASTSASLERQLAALEHGRWVATLHLDDEGEVAGCRCCGTADMRHCPAYGGEVCRFAEIF